MSTLRSYGAGVLYNASNDKRRVPTGLRRKGRACHADLLCDDKHRVPTRRLPDYRRDYANTAARPALRGAHAAQEAELYAGGDHHTGAWHRREYGDLHGDLRGAVASAAV